MFPLLARAAKILQGFLRWWLGELAALLPSGVRAALAGRSQTAVIDLTGPELRIERIWGSKRREIARLPHPDLETGAPLRLPRRQVAAAREIVLRVPFETALRKSMSLPAAAESNLREIVYYELDRQTPFRPDQVYFDHRVRERLASTQRIVVELTVLARNVVDPLLGWLARAEIEPTRVEGAAPDGEPWTVRLPLREGAGEADRTRLARALNPALASLALVLAVTAAYLPIARQEATLADLQAELAIEKRKAEETQELEQRLASISDEALYLVNKKQANAPVLEVWNEITRVMPDDSFALELRLRNGQVEVVGQSEAAAGLLEVIEGSPLFHRAAFRSPITRGRGGEAERFHLAFELRPDTPTEGEEP